jgi:hypothetical protein
MGDEIVLNSAERNPAPLSAVFRPAKIHISSTRCSLNVKCYDGNL